MFPTFTVHPYRGYVFEITAVGVDVRRSYMGQYIAKKVSLEYAVALVDELQKRRLDAKSQKP